MPHHSQGELHGYRPHRQAPGQHEEVAWGEQLALKACPSSSICLLCDLGGVTATLWALVSPSYRCPAPLMSFPT